MQRNDLVLFEYQVNDLIKRICSLGEGKNGEVEKQLSKAKRALHKSKVEARNQEKEVLTNRESVVL